MKRLTAIIVLAIVFNRPCGVFAEDGAASGAIHLVRTANSSFDRYIQGPWRDWIRNSFERMVVYSPYFDSKLEWYPNGWVYIDLYAIYPKTTLPSQHPEWILKDSNGNWLYIPWGCSRGTCPQFAADPSNPEFRAWWISQAGGLLSKGYKGLFVDDVNLEFRVGNGNGDFVNPVDSNTGRAMLWEDWRRYMAEFTEQIRAAFPAAELVHNSIWFAGPAGIGDQDPYIQRQLASADTLEVEFGVNDPGLTGGNGSYSLNALLGHIDHVHGAGRGVIIDGVSTDPIGREYALANYFLITNGSDFLGSNQLTVENWWDGFLITLGAPAGPRSVWNRVMRRDFSGGLVLVNPPQSPVTTIVLPRSFRRIQGDIVNSVVLGPKEGAVLLAATP